MPVHIHAEKKPDATAYLPVVELAEASRLSSEPVIPELVAPQVAAARTVLDTMIQSHGFGIGDRFRGDLVTWFEQGLARLTNSLVMQRFTSFQLIQNPLWRPPAAGPGDAAPDAQRSSLDAFIRWETQEGLLRSDGPYPELGRLLDAWRQNWLCASRDLLQRLEQHRAEIAEFGSGRLRADPPEVVSARFGISDPHDGGRSAAILDFGEFKVVYKPRPVDGEAAWAEVAGTVLREALGLSGFPLRVFPCEGYGFMEFVDHSPCDDLAAVQRCFQRYGGLLALAHGIGTIDLHHENVIVCGEHPVVIDAEPLFRGRLRISSQGQHRLDFERNLSLEGIEARESVLELGLLPIVFRPPLPSDVNPSQVEIEVGALAAYGREPLPDYLPCARNSDSLQMRRVTVINRHHPNLPRLSTEAQLATDHVEEIVSGFETVHRWLIANRESMASVHGPVQDLASCSVRLLVRPTMAYFNVLGRSLSAGPLGSSAARRDQLASDLHEIGALRFDNAEEFVTSEIESLLIGDIPRFDMAAGNERCGSVPLHCSPLASGLERLRSLDASDRGLQVATIRERLINRGARVAQSVPRAADPASLENHGLAIVESLIAAANDAEGAPGWVFTSHAPGFGTTMAHTDRESLYEGAAGVAIVIGEAARIAGRKDWGEFSARVFAPLSSSVPVSSHRGGGLGRGLGGLLYAMLRVSEATSNGALLDTAIDLATNHGSRVGRIDGLDELLNGRAGLLLAILALYERRPDERLLTIADGLAAAILDRGTSGPDGMRWIPPGAAPMANASHGAAGIAMALARYAGARQDSRAADAATEAVRFDDTAWIEDDLGWKDGRRAAGPDGRQTSWSWCNGRSGGILARQAVERALGLPASISAQRARHAPASDVLDGTAPGMCCGTPGVVDCLLQLDSTVPHHARNVTLAIRRLSENNAPSYYSTLSASLFTGTAGLAFGLLRAAHPTRVPSLLWFG